MHECFAADQTLLRKHLYLLLNEFGILPSDGLGGDLLFLLQASGKLLSQTSVSARMPNGYWALLPYSIAHYCTPDADQGLLSRVALACEFLHSALDSFDEIEDDDSSEQRRTLSDGRFLNAATTLYTLVPLIFDTLCPSLLSLEQMRSVQHLLNTALLAAMRGQHQDVLAEVAPLEAFPPEECLRIASAKSGVLFQFVCRLGVQAVHESPALGDLFAEVGLLMGTVAQLENDVHDIEQELATAAGHPSTDYKTDLLRGKKTLPIVLAHKQLAALQNGAQATEKATMGDLPDAHTLAYYHGMKATLGASAHLREHAHSLIIQIEQERGMPMPEPLRFLLTLGTTS